MIVLQNLFRYWTVLDAVELTLAANKFKADDDRLRWRTKDLGDFMRTDLYSFNNTYSQEDLLIPLTPMQIRTFIITLNSRK